MSHFGLQLGIAFQIQDDWLDYVGEENTLGKKVGSDLKLDKKTFVSLKYEELMIQKPELIQEYPARLSGFESLQELKKALTKLPIKSEIEKQIDSYYQDALSSLNSVMPLSDSNALYQVVRSLQSRES
jgi:geranylgeranyl diphosphate synthase type II